MREMAEGTTYVRSVMLEQYANRKFKHHKTTSKVQRTKRVLLHGDGLPWVTAIKHVAKQLCEEAAREGPQESVQVPQEADTRDDEINALSSTCGKLRKHTI